MEAELKHRLAERANAMGGLASMWRIRGMATEVKLGMLGVIVIPIILYGSE